MRTDNMPIPRCLDLPADHGFTMHGWNFSSKTIADAIDNHRMLNPAFELASNVCPWNCDFCFTENSTNLKEPKKRLQGELTKKRRLALIEEAANLGAKSINFTGAGEPTIDPCFWDMLKAMKSCGITPIIYTEASVKLTSAEFVDTLYETGATVVVKVNSLKNADYQNRILRGNNTASNSPHYDYTEKRNNAIELLIEAGFTKPTPTRLAFDTIICKENSAEIEEIHRYARSHNIFVLFVNYLPTGRTKNGHTTSIAWEEQHAIFKKLAKIDKNDYGIDHPAIYPYAGGVPCTIRGLGLFVKIDGRVYDCPSESICLGNLKETALEDIWNKAKDITQNFDGECVPRKMFFRNPL